MPKKRFALATKPQRQLELSWKGGWFHVESDIVVKDDGVIVGTFSKPGELVAGQSIALSDGTPLTLQLVGHRLRVLSEGVELGRRKVNWHLMILVYLGLALFSLSHALGTMVFGIEPFPMPLRYPSSIAWIEILTQFMYEGYGYLLFGTLFSLLAWIGVRRRDLQLGGIGYPLVIAYWLMYEVIIWPQWDGHIARRIVFGIAWASILLLMLIKTLSQKRGS